MRVLCIDPALRNTGYAVVEAIPPPPPGQRRPRRRNRQPEDARYGVIRNHAKILQSGCLVAIRSALQETIRDFHPTTCAMESVIYVRTTARPSPWVPPAAGGHRRGGSRAGAEYPPRRVKQAVVDRGAADKQQVAFMVRAMLGLKETPPTPDAADALAIGITHVQAAQSPSKPRPAPDAECDCDRQNCSASQHG